MEQMDDDLGYPYFRKPPISRQKDLLGKNGCCNLIGRLDLLLKMGHFENKWLPAHVGSGKYPQIIHFNGIFHDINPPFEGTPILGTPQIF